MVRVRDKVGVMIGVRVRVRSTCLSPSRVPTFS